MLYERIEITGYLEDSLEPVSTEECRVRLELSGRPPKAWRKNFRRLMAGPSAQKEGGIGPRVRLSGDGIRLTTKGDFVEDDLDQLREAVEKASEDFEQRYEAALDSQKQIALFLRGEFPRHEAAEMGA